MSTTSLPQAIQFRNVLVAPQTPNLQQMKQLRLRTKNKLKDVILPTNPPTPKNKKNQLYKRPINKSKQNIPLIINEYKKLPKNLSFHYLHTVGNNNQNINTYQYRTNNNMSNIQTYENNINQNNYNKLIITNQIKKQHQRKDQQSQISTLKTSRKIRQNKFSNNNNYNSNQNLNNDCYYSNNNEYNQKTISIKPNIKQLTNHIPILHLQNVERINTQSQSINEYFTPIQNQHQQTYINNNSQQQQQQQQQQKYYPYSTPINNKQKKAQQLQSFKYRAQLFSRHLLQNQKHLLQFLQSQQQSFMQNSSYIQKSFKKLIQEIQQKQHQLLNNLFIHQQSIKSAYKQSLNQIINVKKSIERYKNDIEKHYQDIINQLEMKEFYKIIEKYDNKLNYFKDNIKINIEIVQKNVINVYIPIREIEKVIQKADVRFYQTNINTITNINSNNHINTTNINNNNNMNSNTNINNMNNIIPNPKSVHCQQPNKYYRQSVQKINSNFNNHNNHSSNYSKLNNQNIQFIHENTLIYQSNNKQNHKRNISLKQNHLYLGQMDKKQQRHIFR